MHSGDGHEAERKEERDVRPEVLSATHRKPSRGPCHQDNHRHDDEQHGPMDGTNGERGAKKNHAQQDGRNPRQDAPAIAAAAPPTSVSALF